MILMSFVLSFRERPSQRPPPPCVAYSQEAGQVAVNGDGLHYHLLAVHCGLPHAEPARQTSLQPSLVPQHASPQWQRLSPPLQPSPRSIQNVNTQPRTAQVTKVIKYVVIAGRSLIIYLLLQIKTISAGMTTLA